MLIDSNTVSIDSVAVTSSDVTGSAVPLTSMKYPGREAPIPLRISMVETAVGGTSITFKVQESADGTTDWTDITGSSFTVAVANLAAGPSLIRFIPSGTMKPWIRIVATPSGTFSAGKVFAAVVREEDLPYIGGLYIDKGEVIA